MIKGTREDLAPLRSHNAPKNANQVVPPHIGRLKEERHISQVYDNEEASQTEVYKCVTAIDNAIQGLIIQGTDRREIK